MQLSEKAIQEFKKAYKEEHKTNISEKDALEMGMRLLKLFQVIYQPIKLKVKERRENVDF